MIVDHIYCLQNFYITITMSRAVMYIGDPFSWNTIVIIWCLINMIH